MGFIGGAAGQPLRFSIHLNFISTVVCLHAFFIDPLFVAFCTGQIYPPVCGTVSVNLEIDLLFYRTVFSDKKVWGMLLWSTDMFCGWGIPSESHPAVM